MKEAKKFREKVDIYNSVGRRSITEYAIPGFDYDLFHQILDKTIKIEKVENGFKYSWD